jgi:hypothetical protein
MCDPCHERGKRWPYIDKLHAHPYVAVGQCGQCGEVGLIVECHTYDFRKARGQSHAPNDRERQP